MSSLVLRTPERTLFPSTNPQEKHNMTDNRHLLDVLTREGVLVSVSVRYWRASL